MKLYHYTKSESLIKILVSEKIKFTLIDDLNDPFEFQFDSDVSVFGVDVKRETFEKILREQSAIFCFSKSPESPNNILMLSHYADKHKGWVIEFEFNEKPSNKNIAAGHVEYDKPIPSFRRFFTEIDKSEPSLKNLKKLELDLE